MITGGTGFIGSKLVRTCLRDTSCPVVNLDKLTYAGHRESLADVLDDPRHTLVV
ncbi:NAD-dependent epimerase/dehydratase family protein [Bythopirellula polymerisocia]|uniref:NAD-dependent epimerase/dehydratase family protein n=1 Tax=Bythopirellula polymerisocia TaxID=2528003 RepID=UPI0018D31D86|nr:NAD-dependent epimerase/dehydratase family protein [Bythopirellula polymerisocia]